MSQHTSVFTHYPELRVITQLHFCWNYRALEMEFTPIKVAACSERQRWDLATPYFNNALALRSNLEIRVREFRERELPTNRVYKDLSYHVIELVNRLYGAYAVAGFERQGFLESYLFEETVAFFLKGADPSTLWAFLRDTNESNVERSKVKKPMYAMSRMSSSYRNPDAQLAHESYRLSQYEKKISGWDT